MFYESGKDLIQKEPGVYEDISFEEYTRIDAINHSTLSAFDNQSPFHFYWKRENDQLHETTDALSEGRVIHEAVLQPKLFKNKYIEEPSDWRDYRKYLGKQEENYCLRKEKEAGLEGEGGMSFIRSNSNAHGKIMDAFSLELEDGKESISPELLNKCRAIRENVKKNEACQRIFSGADFEVTMVWIDDETGLKCKGRLDINTGIDGYVCDLKKTRTTNPKWVPSDVSKYHYNSQAAFYIDGAESLGIVDEVKAFVWLMVEGEQPHYILPFYTRATSGWITSGRTWYRQVIEKLNYCKETGDWHGYHDVQNDTFDIYELPEMFS